VATLALVLSTGFSGSGGGAAVSERSYSQRSHLDVGLSNEAAGTREGRSETCRSARFSGACAPLTAEGRDVAQQARAADVSRKREPSAAPCLSARRGLAWYRQRQRDWLKLRDSKATLNPVFRVGRKPRSCPDARYLAGVAKRRSFQARRAYERYLERRRERLQNPSYAICWVFKRFCSEALRVASCESGRGVHARNGEYLGIFQMGSSERRLYGHGDTPLEQAQAAYRYFADSGFDWSPWSCKP
jgi:hypothetical protein